MKALIALTVILAIASAQFQDDQADINAALDSFWTGIGLPKPTSFEGCIDAPTATTFKNFGSQILTDACAISLSNIQKIIDEINKFQESLPQSLKDCFQNSPDTQALIKKIGNVDTAKVIAYVTSHFSAIKKSICDIKDTWNKGDFSGAGSKAMVLLKQVLGIKMPGEELEDLPVDNYLRLHDARSDFQTWLNAFFTDYGLPNPTTILACADDATLAKIYQFVPTAMDKACHLNIGNIPAFIEYMKNFFDSLPDDAKKCIDANKEFQDLVAKIGPIDTQKVIAYVTSHFSQVRSSACDIEKTWNSGDFAKAGTMTADLLKKVLGSGSEIDIEEIISEIVEEITY